MENKIKMILNREQLKQRSVICDAIRKANDDDAAKMICDMYRDNPSRTIEFIGRQNVLNSFKYIVNKNYNFYGTEKAETATREAKIQII